MTTASDRWNGPLTQEDVAFLAERRQQAEAAREIPSNKKVTWSTVETAALRALKRENPDLTGPQLAKKYLAELWVAGTDFVPSEKQVVTKIKHESVKG
ncbi:hypothetical protein HDV00_003129 [Rhizophlyctis rosea]|nr:hypothetical protein HDV00_003129 [Rhizophlyctis rosea]